MPHGLQFHSQVSGSTQKIPGRPMIALLHVADGHVNWYSYLTNSVEGPLKMKWRTAMSASGPLLGVHLQEMKLVC